MYINVFSSAVPTAKNYNIELRSACSVILSRTVGATALGLTVTNITKAGTCCFTFSGRLVTYDPSTASATSLNVAMKRRLASETLFY